MLLIDPVNKITDYNRNDRELQIFWLFTILVANKPAQRTAELLTRMLSHRPPDELPFLYLQKLGERRRRQWLEKHRTGQYTRIGNALTDTFTSRIDLRVSDIHDFVRIRGVKYKTAYFFLLHSRPDVTDIVIDTHILKYLRDNGVAAPKTTPQNEQAYKILEESVRKLFARDYPEKTTAEADFLVWSKYHERAKSRNLVVNSS